MRLSHALALGAVAALFTGAALAQDTDLPPLAPVEGAMSLAEFDTYATGKTLTWSQYGAIYGIEEYLPGRKVRWKTAPDECQYGSWYERSGFICFRYEYSQSEHCWSFWLEDGALKALVAGADPTTELVEVEQTANGLACPAPDVGV